LRFLPRPVARRANAIAYLKGRGLTGEIAARFGLGYAPAGWDNLRIFLITKPWCWPKPG
jgi:DNA primase